MQKHGEDATAGLSCTARWFDYDNPLTIRPLSSREAAEAAAGSRADRGLRRVWRVTGEAIP